MQLEDFKLSEQQIEEGVDLHDVQHLVSLPQFDSKHQSPSAEENKNSSMDIIESDM